MGLYIGKDGKLNFVQLGVIPAGFLMKDGTYEDIVLFDKTL